MILVTGATGNVGAALVQQLHERGATYRIGVRNGASAGANEVHFDFLDPSTFAPAVAGCSAVFLLRPPPIANTRATLNPFIDAAYAHGVRQVVFVSVVGASDNRLMPHYAVEQHLRRSGQDWTILQPGFFAQNLGDAYREDIVRDNRLYLPAGRGRIAFVDVRDIAEVAAQALLDPAMHRQRTYVLTGGETTCFSEAASMLSTQLQRTVRYEPASIAGYLLHLRGRGAPLRQAVVQTILHTGLRFGQAERIDPTLGTLLQRAPRRLRDYIQDHRALWASHPV